MDRTVSASVYRVRPKRGSQVLPIAAFQAFSRDADEVEILDGLVRMHRVSSRQGVWGGEFLRRQVENFPPRARKRGNLLPLELAEGEGLGHGAAFLFNAANDILVWEHVRSGASLSRFAGYLSHLANAEFVIEPVVGVDTLAQLNQARTKRIKVRLAEPDDLRAIDAQQRSVKSAFRLFGDVADGAYVEVTIGSERGSFLPRLKIREIVRWLRQESDEDRGGIQKLQIDGRIDSDEVTVIDLLKGRMREHTRLDIDGANLERNFTRRMAWLVEVYDQFRSDIDRLFPRQ